MLWRILLILINTSNILLFTAFISVYLRLKPVELERLLPEDMRNLEAPPRVLSVAEKIPQTKKTRTVTEYDVRFFISQLIFYFRKSSDKRIKIFKYL